MGYASKQGCAPTNPNAPEAKGVCMRCGLWYSRRALRNQVDWRGASLLPLYIFVCNECYDTPAEFLRAIVVPADPLPVYLALPEPFEQDETDFLTTNAPTVYDPVTGIPIPSTTTFITQDSENLTTQPYGEPTGLIQNAIPPLKGQVHYGVKLPMLSLIANGTTTISATCSAPHGLSTNSQISVEGITDGGASGFYSVTVTSATAFTYQTINPVSSNSLLTPTTNIITVSIGLPYGYQTIPVP
jgi:hypothetical protein